MSSGVPAAISSPPPAPPFGSEVDDPIGGFDDVEVVLDNHHRVALVAQSVEHVQELRDVVEVQSGGGFVEDVERLAGTSLGEFTGQLDPLRLAAGEGGCALAEAHVGQPHIDEGISVCV